MPEPLNFQIDEYYLDLQQKGQVMEIIDEEETRRNPFPGLRPFRTSEAHLFFGREGQSEELIERLMRTRFLGVLGNSGSGKSSLVRAGLIPALHAGRKQAQVSDWKIVICRPGNSPIQNLAAALAGAALKDTRREVVEPEVRRLLPLLMESSFGLLEAEEGKGVRDKTLLIVDQFEELFRFGKEIPPGEAAHFVDLLLNAVGQEGAHIYVVITMRSEFLGECVRYRGLPEIINSGQYLVPRLSGENVRRAVTGPLAVVHAPVDAAFANRVVREVGDNMDQLPLMQHALMRSYKKWQDGGGQSSLGHVEYDAVGGMQQAMGHHADELYAALDDKGRAIARLLFQRLTDLSAGEQGGRRPTLMAEIYGLCEAVSANRTEVDAVIERFRDIGASFLMPPPGVALHDGNMLDISHESLVRNWTRLGGWAVEETEAARLYQRLEQGRMETHEEGGGLPPRVLENLCEWLEKSRINAFWAARYHPGVEPAHDWGQHKERFEHNMRFLEGAKDIAEAKVRARDNEIAEKAREKQRVKYRSIIIALAVSAAVVGFSLAGFAWNQAQLAEVQKVIAEAERRIADSSATVARNQSELAKQKTKEAETNLFKAQKAEKRALSALQQVQKEKAATEEQRRKAEDNYRIAQTKTQEAEASAAKARQALAETQRALEEVVRLTLVEVDRWVYQLEYEKAYEQLRGIQSLRVSQGLVSSALLEFAFWYGETGELSRAWGILDTAYQLLGRRLDLPGQKDLPGLRTKLRSLDEERWAFLQSRYFPDLVAIPGGDFTMGSENGESDEKPVHEVSLSGFSMTRSEVTWWQYGLYASAERGIEMPASGWGTGGDSPVVNVSWYDALGYANWLSERSGVSGYYKVDKEKKDPGNKNEYDELKWTVLPREGSKGYRLPTEAEWEYAARGGRQQEWAGTNVEDSLGYYAWYRANSGIRPRPVMGKMSNPFGLYDMSGNVWEWCWDWYGGYGEAAQSNPRGPSEGSNRVLRGGGWNDGTERCRSANRPSIPVTRANDVGFRLVFVP